MCTDSPQLGQLDLHFLTLQWRESDTHSIEATLGVLDVGPFLSGGGQTSPLVLQGRATSDLEGKGQALHRAPRGQRLGSVCFPSCRVFKVVVQLEASASVCARQGGVLGCEDWSVSVVNACST